MRATGCDENEGRRIKKQFDGTYKILSNWWTLQHQHGREHGYVKTAFGRQYPVPDIQLPRFSTDKNGRRINNNGFIAKAERNAVNGPIQGSGADIIKIAMARVYAACKKRKWLEKVLMIATMHDELVFEVDLDILEEAIEVLCEEMCRNPVILGKKWSVPLTLDVEVGFNWTVPWNITEMKHGKKAWLPELAPYFLGAPKDPKKDFVTEDSSNIDVETLPEPPKKDPVKRHQKVNEEFVYKVKSPLTVLKATKLAKVIVECQGSGTSKLRLVNDSGDTVVIGSGKDIFINENQFYVLARRSGI